MTSLFQAHHCDWSLGELSEQSPSGKQGWDQQPSALGENLPFEAESGELSGRDLPTQLRFSPNKCLYLPPAQMLTQGIVSLNPALYSEGSF